MTHIPPLSPFQLLQSYDKKDSDYYFGRDKETRQLYDALMRSKFMMVYGASGTGKTSLIKCGLQSMFSPRDWMPLVIRREDDFLGPIHDRLYEIYQERFKAHQEQQAAWYPDDPMPEPETFDNLRDLIKAVFHLSYVPIYLILDQFEEIFTLGEKAEQDEFFQTLKELELFSEDLFCKIIIVTREEYIAHFYRYEKMFPFLFEYRFRVEKMREEQLLQVIEGMWTAEYPGHNKFELKQGASQQIFKNLLDDRGEVDLTTLQVYNDRLYQEDRARAGQRNYIQIDKPFVIENKLDNVLTEFLDGQVDRVSNKLMKNFPEELRGGGNPAMLILYQMVTDQGTKRSRSTQEIHRELQTARTGISPEFVQACLDEFASPESRVINRLKYAKTTEERFEIMHDRLADRIAKNINADEMRRRGAVTTIKNKLGLFQEDKGSDDKKSQEYLSKGELELVQQSLNVNGLEKDQKQFYHDSIAFHERVAKRERNRTRKAIGFGLFSGVIALFAVIYYFKADAATTLANEKQREATANLETANENLRQFRKARYDEIVKRAEGYVALKSDDYALYEYQQAAIYWKDTLYMKETAADTVPVPDFPLQESLDNIEKRLLNEGNDNKED